MRHKPVVGTRRDLSEDDLSISLGFPSEGESQVAYPLAFPQEFSQSSSQGTDRICEGKLEGTGPFLALRPRKNRPFSEGKNRLKKKYRQTQPVRYHQFVSNKEVHILKGGMKNGEEESY